MTEESSPTPGTREEIMRVIQGLVALIGISGFVFSASADTINGCVKQKSGKLRIVGDPGQCTDREASVSWGSDGSQGPVGPQGIQGPQGEAGPAPPRYELVGFAGATLSGARGAASVINRTSASCRGRTSSGSWPPCARFFFS